MKKRTVALLMALMLLVGIAAGGTVAWLTSKTETVKNTFTVGNVGDLTLTEADTEDGDDNPNTNDYLIVPGENITKDPKVTYEPAEGEQGKLVDAYVFVKVDKGDDWVVADDGITYTKSFGKTDAEKMSFAIAEGWTALTGYPGVYYQTVAADETLNEVSIIAGDKITVGSGITKAELQGLTSANNMNLTFTAYAIQKDGFATPAAAWTTVLDVES